MSIRTKLVALLIGSCFTALLVACIAFVVFDRQSSAEYKQHTLTVLADAVAASESGAVAFGDQASAKVVLQALAAEPSAEAARVYSAQDGLLTGWSRREGVDVPPPQAQAPLNAYVDGRLVLTRSIPGAEGGSVGMLVVVFSTADLDARSLRFIGLAGLVLLAATLTAALAAARLHRVISGPVVHLAEAAGRVRDHGDYAVRATKSSNDELGVLTDTFNAMLGGIQARDEELASHRQGLEDLVAKRTAALDQRNRAMKLVLDHVDQGLVTLDREARPSSERSAAFDRWFGTPDESEPVGNLLARQHAMAGLWFQTAWESVVDGVLPIELALEQMPKSLELSGRHYRFAYTPIQEDGELSRLLLIASDVTTVVEKERMEALQREFLDVVERMLRDRSSVEEFIEEANGLIARIGAAEGTRVELMRALHTLKGNAAVFGIHSIAELCHQLETQMEHVAQASPAMFVELVQRWTSFVDRTRALLGEDVESIHVPRSDYDSLLRAVHQHTPHDVLGPLVRSWKYERLDGRLARLAVQASSVARRLGKGEVDVTVDAQGLRIPRERWAPLWSSMVHVLRNALDHGIESTEERARTGKLGSGQLALRARLVEERVVMEVSDDGRGIDWARVRSRAQAVGLPTSTPEQLTAALFADGLSTRETVSETSGRGVGLGAVRSVCQELGVHFTVVSTLGQGTTFRFELPLDPPSAEVTRAWRSLGGRQSLAPRPRLSLPA